MSFSGMPEEEEGHLGNQLQDSYGFLYQPTPLRARVNYKNNMTLNQKLFCLRIYSKLRSQYKNIKKT